MSAIDRRSALGLAGGGLMAALAPAVARAKSGLAETVLPMSALLPHTRYFEIDSQIAGARYGVWVTTPSGYEKAPERRYPIVYQPDGNDAAPSTIPTFNLLGVDAINPIQSFIQVCVGYTGADVGRALAVRARDLLPPHEALPEGMIEAMKQAPIIGDILDRAGTDLYIHNLENPAADKFLAFLTDELHPLIAAAYRVDSGNAGLFGYSYGGLFATYAALTRSPLFKRIGAGSPGILARRSRVFEMYAAEFAAKADYSGRMLHMTLCEPELNKPTIYQPMVAAGTAEFITLAGQQPLKGLAFSSHIIPFESHITGIAPSYASYLRTCYGA